MKNNTHIQKIKEVCAFAMPISIGMLVNMIASFIAMIMVAQRGSVELAAGALAISTTMTLTTIMTTVFYAVSILISHTRSLPESNKQIGQIVKNSYWLALALTLPGVFMLWNVSFILVLFKQDPHLIALANGYFHFSALALIPILISMVNIQFFTGIGKPRLMMLISLLGLPLNVFFSYGFIFGHFGLPALGLAGIAFALLLSQIITCAGIFGYLFLSNIARDYAIFNQLLSPPNWPLMKKIFSLGFPIGIQFGAELAAMAIATYFMGYFGVTALAASQIVSQYNILIVMITLGLSQALSILVSKAYGQNNLALIREYFFAANSILFIIFTFVFMIFLFAPNLMMWIYLPANELADDKLRALTINFFLVSGVTLLIDGIRNLLISTLRGLHDSKAPMQIGVMSLWLISLPACYLIGFNLHGGPVGLRIGFMLGFVAAVVLLWQRLKGLMSAKLINETP